MPALASAVLAVMETNRKNKCYECRKEVPEGTTALLEKNGGWLVICPNCAKKYLANRVAELLEELK